MNNKANDVRFLMKQKLSERSTGQNQKKDEQNQQSAMLTGKERLQLLKSLKEKPPVNNAANNKNISQKKVNQNDQQKEKLKFADEVEVKYFEKNQSISGQYQSDEDDDELNTTKSQSSATSSITQSSTGFPAGFFDNPYEEKIILDSMGATRQPSKEEDQLQQSEQPIQEQDLDSFMQEINAIGEPTESIRSDNTVDDESSVPSQSIPTVDENTEPIEPIEEEEEDPMTAKKNEELFEELVQTTYLTKLGLLYKRLDQLNQKKQKDSNSLPLPSSDGPSIQQIEKEIKELQVLIDNSLDTTNGADEDEEDDDDEDGYGNEDRPTTRRNVATSHITNNTTIIENLYFQKMQKKRKFSQPQDQGVMGNPPQKKTKHDDSQHQTAEKQEDDKEENEDSEDDDDAEEEEGGGGGFVYNPLDFMNSWK